MASSFRNWLSSVGRAGLALCLASVALPVGAQESADPTLAQQTLDVEVNPAEQSEAFSRQFEIKLNDDVASQFGNDNPVQWAPNLTQQSLMPSREFGVSHDPVSLGLTKDISKNFDISIDFDRPPLLMKDGEQESRKLKLTVNNPRKLKPGVYEGLIASELQSLKTGDKRSFAWPVRLRVQGTSVTSIKFLAVDESVPTAALRVGMPASVRIHVRTIECEPSGGQFELTWKRDEKSSDKPELMVRLPLVASQSWIDPKFGLPPGAHCAKQWLQEPFMVQLVGSAASDTQGVRLHEFQIMLPQVFDVGIWTARISWPKFPGQSSAVETAHSLVARAGVRILPALPAANEEVELFATLESDAGEVIHLQITHPDKTLQKLEALKLEGNCYKAVANLPTNGQYAVQIVLPNLAEGAKVFEVPFVTRDDLGRDLYVFVGAPYVPFDLIYGAKWGGGWEALRQSAYYLQTNPANFGNLRATLSGIVAYKGEDGSQEQLLTESVHWAREPEFSFPVDSATKETLAVYDREKSSQLPAGAPLMEWVADPANHSIGFDLNASVRDGENVQDSPRQITGERIFELRLLVTGKSADGQPVARIINVPFGVRIVTDRQYYIPALLYSLASLTVLGLVWVGVRYLTPPVPRSASVATPPSSAQDSFAPSENYVPPALHPTTTSVAESAAVVTAGPSEDAWQKGGGESQPSSTTGSTGGFGVSSGFGPEE